MKLNKRGAIERDMPVKTLIVLIALGVILLIFAPKIKELLWIELVSSDQCDGLTEDQSRENIINYLSKNNKVEEGLFAYKAFKDCFPNDQKIFTLLNQKQYEDLISLEMTVRKLTLNQRQELYQKYVDNYPGGNLAFDIMSYLNRFGATNKASVFFENFIKSKPSNKDQLCEAYFEIIYAKLTEQGETEAIKSLSYLKNNWDKCITHLKSEYPSAFSEEKFLYGKDQFFKDLEANLKGEKTEREKAKTKILSTSTIQDSDDLLRVLGELLEEYKGTEEERLINFKLGEFYNRKGENRDIDKAIEYFKKAYSKNPYTFNGNDLNEESLVILGGLYKEKDDKNEAYTLYSTYIKEYPTGFYADEVVNEIISIAQNKKDNDMVKHLLDRLDQYISSVGFSNDGDNIKDEVYSRRLLVEKELSGVDKWLIIFKGKADPKGFNWGIANEFVVNQNSNNHIKNSPKTIFGEGIVLVKIDEDGRNINSISELTNIKLEIPLANNVHCIQYQTRSVCYFDNSFNKRIEVKILYIGTEKDEEGNDKYIKYSIEFNHN
jgi:tetratricopeptide (TPR) repeat protein